MSWVSRTPPPGAVEVSYALPLGPVSTVQLTPEHPRGTALLVPGYSGSKEDFGPLLPLLAAGGWRVVAMDLRGQLGSVGPPDESAYTVEALATEVLDVAGRLPGPLQLVGHSFGGLVCRAAAIRSGERLAGLTLLGSGPAALTGPRMDVLALLPGVLEQGGIVAIADAADAFADADPDGGSTPPETRLFLRERWLAASGAGLVAMAAALRDEPDRVDALRDSGTRVLVLHGADDDAWSPALQAEMAQRLGAAHAVVPFAKHSPAVEAPEATAQALLAFWG